MDRSRPHRPAPAATPATDQATPGRPQPPGLTRSTAVPCTKTPDGGGGARRAARHRADWALALPPTAALAMMLWGITAPSY